jgi:hypothetical protein
LFFAYAKTGAKLEQGETVLPYFGPLKVFQTGYDPYVSGRVFVTRDKIMENLLYSQMMMSVSAAGKR